MDRNVPDAFYKSMLNSFNEMVQFVSLNGLVSDFKERIVKTYNFTQNNTWSYQEAFSRALDILD